MAYTKQNFSNGNVLTAEQLNHMENGIAEAANDRIIEVPELPTENIDKGAIYVRGDYRSAAELGEDNIIGYRWIDSNAWRFEDRLTPYDIEGGYYDVYITCSFYIYHTETMKAERFSEFHFYNDPEGTEQKIEIKNAETGEWFFWSSTIHGMNAYLDSLVHFTELPKGERFIAWLNENATNQSGFKRITSVELADNREEFEEESKKLIGKAAEAATVADLIRRVTQKIDNLGRIVVRVITSESQMENELEYATNEFIGDEKYTGDYYYIYIGETTENYTNGAVYHLKELV